MRFDLPAYLTRIGLKEIPSRDAEGLTALQRAHRLAIPFENIDIVLGHGISLAPEAIFDKLVMRRRGGYCFEHNHVLREALEMIGFDVRPLLARVWLGADGIPPRTHMLNLVTIGGAPWIADAGFGGSYTPPMPLAEGEVTAADGVRHRLVRDDDHDWMLERLGAADATRDDPTGQHWQPQYSFTTDRVWPADIHQANHFTATVPGGRFTSNVVASIVLPNGFATILNRDYSRTSAKGTERAEIVSPRAFRMRLSLMFGIDLTAEEIDALRLFPA